MELSTKGVLRFVLPGQPACLSKALIYLLVFRFSGLDYGTIVRYDWSRYERLPEVSP